ncbi:MAG: sigma-54 dependent transcriptional regulator [Pirellulales bacterium]
MTEIRELMLEVWREVSRHLEISESIKTIAQLLFDQSGIVSVRLDRVYTGPNRLETVASESRNGAAIKPLAVPLSDDELAALSKLLSERRSLSGTKSADFENLSSLVQPSTSTISWLTPLPSPEQLPEPRDSVESSTEGSSACSGVLVVTSAMQAELQHVRRLLAELQEPLAVALSNDHRLHELKVLREAADADRRTLLERLGRHQVHDEIVGANRGLRSVMERVELVADSDIPVLILGETGTGKEVISRAIHQRSKRANGPFVRVNCGAIPPELIDSQLFGHEKGSFTGAVDQHQGWFERSDGGTLFLDEIGELPLAAQVRLLRVLQDHQIERVGGKKPIHVDVRIVAATHRDLSNMVRERTFREDLWYRINVFPVFLPRLRDRVEDLPTLAKHFAQRAAERFGLQFVEPSPQDLLSLANYPWPGNVRELGAVIDRAVILGRGRSFDVAGALGLSKQAQPTLDTGPTYYEVIPESLTAARQTTTQTATAPIVDLNEAMRQHIKKALTACRGRIEGELGAAKMLGINPHTLRARMRKLEIDWDSFRE